MSVDAEWRESALFYDSSHEKRRIGARCRRQEGSIMLLKERPSVAADEAGSREPEANRDAATSHGSDVALVVMDGEPLGRHIAIGHAPVIIGRGVEADLQIVDPTVSRYHCVIWRAAGRCWVRDLGSTNQTRINSRPVRIAELFEGDIVLVGQTALTLAGLTPHRVMAER
jgi:hypothetical protein